MCRITDLRNKEVINITDGSRLGCVYDAEFDVCTAKIVAIIVPGPAKFFGLFGRDEDYIIPWDNIEKIGDDIILVCYNIPHYIKKKKKGMFS